MKSLKLVSSLLFVALLSASTPFEGVIINHADDSQNFGPYEFETLTISSAALPFTATKVTSGSNQANYVAFTVNCASGTTCILRFRVDGLAIPSTTLGTRALYGDEVQIYGNRAIKNFRGIRETSTDVLIDTTYFK